MKWELIENLYTCLSKPVYRVILGDKVNSEPGDEFYLGLDNDVRGTAGYMDFIIGSGLIPTKDSLGKSNILSKELTLVVLIVYVPKSARKTDAALTALGLVETFANKFSVSAIKLDAMRNDAVKKYAEWKKYTLYLGSAIKYLK